MNDKFKYAPGRPGVGTKGEKGEDGKQGLGMYFTNLNPNSQSSIINNRIRDDKDLWAGSSGGLDLPDNRIYLTGDLFFDQEGLAYEINAESNTFEYKFASLNMGGFFLPLGISSSDGFQRYFNSNASPKFLIDNVYTLSGAIDYTDAPERIYNIEPKDFTRIEYTNIKSGTGNYNPFTVYSSAENIAENHKALAIVYDEANLSFRIGNLDDANNVRNTNLKFDVSSLIHSKTTGGQFSLNTPEGAILTNYEINANPLFDPNFNSDPSSFSVIYQTLTSDISINWILDDITQGYEWASLHVVINKRPYGGSYSFDSSTFRELVFTDLPGIGGILVTDCPSSNVYSCYIKMSKKGWSRNTATKNAFAAVLSVTPSSFPLDSSDAGTVGFDVDSNFEWVASFTQNPENFMSLDSSTMGTYDGSLNIDFTANASTRARLGKIRVAPIFGGTFVDVSIWQPRGTVPPELFLINGGTYLKGSSPNYYIDASQNGDIEGSGSATFDVSSNRSWTASVPSGLYLYPNSGSAGVTSVSVSTDSNATLDQIEKSISFSYGGDSPAYLEIRVDPIIMYASISTPGDPYDLQFYASGGSAGYAVPPWNGYLDILFDPPSSSIEWEFSQYPTWMSTIYPTTGTGDTYGIYLVGDTAGGTRYGGIDVSAGGAHRFVIYVDQQ